MIGKLILFSCDFQDDDPYLAGRYGKRGEPCGASLHVGIAVFTDRWGP